MIKVNIDVPFPTSRSAQIAYDVLRIDPEPKRGGVQKNFEINENILKMWVLILINCAFNNLVMPLLENFPVKLQKTFEFHWQVSMRHCCFA